MVLTKYDIRELCKTQSLITQYIDRNIQSNSYDLRMGNQFYCYCHEDEASLNIQTLGSKTENDEFEIPADAICYVISMEALNMPLHLTAEITLSFGLIKRGVMLAKQPPIDPGYKGRIVALLHNLSNEPIKIRRGDHILSIVFYELKQEIQPADAYHSSYQNMMTLKQFGMKNKGGALYALKHDLEEQTGRLESNMAEWTDNLKSEMTSFEKKQKKSVNRILAIINTAITVIIAILTILIGFMTGESFWSNSPGKNNESTTDAVNIHVDEDSIVFGQYSILLDGGTVSEFSVEENVVTIKLETGGN